MGLIVVRFALGYDVHAVHWTQVIFPITRGAYWYLSAFSLLFVLSPLLSHAIRGVRKRDLVTILSFVFLICSMSSPWFKNEYNGFGMGLIDGYSTIWLLVMYLVGGYFGKYKEDMLSKRVCATVMLLCAVISTMLYILLLAKIPIISAIASRIGVAGGYRNPVVVIMSVSIFLFSVQMPVRADIVKWCLKWGASVSFGVYLIHVHPYVWRNIWVPKLHNVHIHCATEWLAWVLGGTVLVYISCGALESLRVLIFKIFRINRLASIADRITCNE